MHITSNGFLTRIETFHGNRDEILVIHYYSSDEIQGSQYYKVSSVIRLMNVSVFIRYSRSTYIRSMIFPARKTARSKSVEIVFNVDGLDGVNMQNNDANIYYDYVNGVPSGTFNLDDSFIDDKLPVVKYGRDNTYNILSVKGTFTNLVMIDMDNQDFKSYNDLIRYLSGRLQIEIYNGVDYNVSMIETYVVDGVIDGIYLLINSPTNSYIDKRRWIQITRDPFNIFTEDIGDKYYIKLFVAGNEVDYNTYTSVYYKVLKILIDLGFIPEISEIIREYMMFDPKLIKIPK